MVIDVKIGWKNGWLWPVMHRLLTYDFTVITSKISTVHLFFHLILTSITIIYHYNLFAMLGMPGTRLYQNLAKVCVSSMFCVASVSCVWVFAKTLFAFANNIIGHCDVVYIQYAMHSDFLIKNVIYSMICNATP